MDYIIKVAFVFFAGIVILAIIFFAGQAADIKRDWALENMSKYTKKTFQMLGEPDATLIWELNSQRRADTVKVRFLYKISMKGVGLKNTDTKDVSVVPVLLFKNNATRDSGLSVIKLQAGEQDYNDLNFELVSGDAPLIKASDVKMPDEKKYVVDDFGKNAILAGFYGVTITDALSPALSDGQNLFINDFMIKATPFALLVKNIQLSKCEVPITVKCKNEMQILMLKDYNRKYSITNDPCSNDPDNICKKTLNMCGGKIDIELIRTDKNCNFVAHINIETTSRLTNEDRKKYPLGETAVLSFWKEGSDCWKEPLKIVSGCEDDFYGAYNILIPADKYNKEGVTAPIPPAPTSPCDGLDESACKAKSECYWSVIGNGECLECSSNAMPLGCNHLARSDCTVNGKCGVSNCEWDQIMFDNTGIGCWTRIA